jgi:hypothetical protein
MSVGCAPKVEVRTGTKVICTYGEVVSDDIRTIKVPAADVAKYSVRTVTRICDTHTRLEALYREAQDAIAAGDLATAKKKLEAVIALDAGFAQAGAQLGIIASGGTPKADSAPVPSGTTTSTPKPGDGTTGNPAESLLAWAPDAISGYTASKPTIDPLSIARQYVPASDAKPVTFVIVVEQFRNNAGAKVGLKEQVTSRYTRNKATLTVNGRSVYYGTDGRRYAAIGFVDGSVMVALEMSAAMGESPNGLKSSLEKALKELP